eukprot:gene7222-11537_t
MSTVKEILEAVKVEECAPKSSKILVLSSEDHVPDALKKLIDMNIVSAPVINEETKEFLGLLDVVDILAFVVSIFDNKSTDKEHGGNIFKSLTASEKYSKQPIGDITNIMHNSITPVKVGTNLWDVLQIFVDGAHRVPVITEEGKLISILTQAAVVNTLAKHPNALGELGKQDVQTLKIEISGVGVVDQSGKLMGNISARDLKYIKPNQIFSNMLKSCGQFISDIKQSIIEENAPVIAVNPDTKFSFVLGRMAVNRIHRLYVCDKDQKPTAIISLRDLLTCVHKNQ